MNVSVAPSISANFPLTQLALISGPDASEDDLAAILGTAPRIKLQKLTAAAVQSGFAGDGLDLAVVNVARVSDIELETLNTLAAQAPDLPVIVVSPELHADEMRRLFRIGIYDWLPSPVMANDLFGSIKKGARKRPSHQNRVHAVMSSVGGAGASTVAVTMTEQAARMTRRSGQSTALFDLDFSLGNCGIYANLQNDFSLSSVAATPRRVDREFIRAIQKRHADGFYLYSFKQPAMNGEVNGYELVLRMLDAVTSEHHQTFLDIPYYMTDWRDEVLSAVNTCTLVTELNLSAIKHTLDQIETIRELRGADFPVRVALNKWQPRLFGQRVGRKQLRELFGDVPFLFLREDAATIGEAVDRGLLPSQVKRRSPFVKGVMGMIKEMQREATA